MAERVVRAATAMALCASVGTANAGPCSGLDLCDTLGLFSGGKRVGHLIECLREQPNGAVLETNAIDAEVTTGGGGPRVTVSIEETRLFDSLGALVRASQRIAGASGETEWKLTKARGQWRITTVTAGQPSTQILPNYGGERIDTYCSLYRQILEGTIEEGDTWIDTSVELTSGRTVATKLVCKGVPGKGGGQHVAFCSAR